MLIYWSAPRPALLTVERIDVVGAEIPDSVFKETLPAWDVPKSSAMS
jgi:hypothetical protein